MKMEGLRVAISYETRLVRRNWLYRLVLAGVFVYVLAFLVPWDAHIVGSEEACDESIPQRIHQDDGFWKLQGEMDGQFAGIGTV